MKIDFQLKILYQTNPGLHWIVDMIQECQQLWIIYKFVTCENLMEIQTFPKFQNIGHNFWHPEFLTFRIEIEIFSFPQESPLLSSRARVEKTHLLKIQICISWDKTTQTREEHEMMAGSGDSEFEFVQAQQLRTKGKSLEWNGGGKMIGDLVLFYCYYLLLWNG